MTVYIGFAHYPVGRFDQFGDEMRGLYALRCFEPVLAFGLLCNSTRTIET